MGEEGVIILTDMFGGTPSNLSYSFLEEGRIEVLSGVNLPILIQAVNMRKKMKLDQLAANLEAFGKRSISLASGILKGKPSNKIRFNGPGAVCPLKVNWTAKPPAITLSNQPAVKTGHRSSRTLSGG
jgi:hypothetical protein